MQMQNQGHRTSPRQNSSPGDDTGDCYSNDYSTRETIDDDRFLLRMPGGGVEPP